MKNRVKDVDKPAYFLYWFENYKDDPNYTLDYITIPVFDDAGQVTGFTPYVDKIDEILSLENDKLSEIKKLKIYNELYKKCMVEDSTGFEVFDENKFMEWLREYNLGMVVNEEPKDNYNLTLNNVFGE